MMNEQHCSELVSQFIVNQSLPDVFPILGSNELYVTLEHLISLAQEYHDTFSGGRVTSLELQSYLNVDMHFVDKVIQKVFKCMRYSSYCYLLISVMIIAWL